MLIIAFIFINYKKLLESMYKDMIQISLCKKVNGINFLLEEGKY